MDEQNKQNKLYLIISIVIVSIVVVVGITYAFFSARTTNNAEVSVDVTTSPQVEITFENGTDLDLNAYQPGISASSNFDIKMVSDGSNITGVYDIIWNITENSFVHDTTLGNENDAEITYSFYYSMDAGENKNWTAITENADLTWDGTSSFPMQIPLATNEIISACASANDCATTVRKYYKLTVTYPSLNKDQKYNMQKELHGTIEFKASV